MAKKLNIFQQIRNFFITPTGTDPNSSRGGVEERMAAGGSTNKIRNVSNTLIPIQLPRIAQDVGNWRDSLTEAENAWYPYRVLINQLYIDTVNDGHVRACMEKRKNLTLLREFALVDENDKQDDEWTAWLDKNWFREYLNHTLDALFYGYTLVSLGDIVNNEFPCLSIVRRWNISPDRLNVASVTYNPNGVLFLEGEVAQWHIWIKTPSDIGVSNCGYGLLYPVSYSAIMIRNNNADNASYNELFGMPIKVIKSNTSNEQERAEMYNDLKQMGGAGGIVLKENDIMELVEAKSGNGFKSYENFEQRHQKLISKLILGHSDSLEPTQGKGLGSSTGAKDGKSTSESQLASDALQTRDAHFVIPYIEEFLDRCRSFGINIPENLHFIFKNDNEEEDIKKKANDLALQISEISANFAKGGIQLDPAFIESITGFKVKTDPALEQKAGGGAPISNRILNAKKDWNDESNYKGSGHNKEEYLKDKEYREATGDTDGMPTLDKEGYEEWTDEVQEHIDTDTPLDVRLDKNGDGDVGLHINCNCEIVDGEWVNNDMCDDCNEAMEDYNNSTSIENKLEIFKKHKNKN